LGAHGGACGAEFWFSADALAQLSRWKTAKNRIEYDTARFITISGPLSGPVTPIDVGITSSTPLTGWVNKPILKLDSSYSAGNLAELKALFTLGNLKRTDSPSTEAALTGYGISNGGLFVVATPATPSANITYSDVSGGTWTLESDGRRRSPATGHGSTTKSRISFTSTAANAVITIQLDVSSELGYDFAFISTLNI
jgi:hypothetical protein